MNIIFNCLGPPVPLHCDYLKTSTAVDEKAGLSIGQSRSEMPQQVQRILAKTKNEVAYQQQTGFLREYIPPMNRRVRQAGITIVTADEQVKHSARNPTFRLNGGKALPSEWAA